MTPTVTSIPDDPETAAMKALLRAEHGDPFAFLGLHHTPMGYVVRVFRPDAQAVEIRAADATARSWKATKLDREGFFVAEIPEVTERFRYHVLVTDADGNQTETIDPYSFGPMLGEMDQHLFGEGQDWQLWHKMGAHQEIHDEVAGTVFRVWAPNANRVSVVGDWNRWDGRTQPMRKIIPSGIWEIFIPGVKEGMHYKFEIKGADGHLHMKSDPYAFYGQHSRQTASMVWDLGKYTWSDDDWIKRRSTVDWHRQPVSIYEVHLGSWRRNENNDPLTYREHAKELLDYVVEMGYTHIELMPVAEHPFDGSWGYQICGYFAPTSRFGSPDDFRWFVDCCHQQNIGVILDWVPGHFPKDGHGLARFDGTSLYEHSDPRQGEHQDWGTLIFNFGRTEVRNFLIANALFWLEEYHIDGLRVDAVASMLYLDYSRTDGGWVPNIYGGRENLDAIYFIKRFNELCYERHPGVLTIAEESTAWPGVSKPTFLGGLGFGMKWNMGWMNDTLSYMAADPVYRRYHHGEATFSLVYAFHENFVLVLSHDEVVHGKGSIVNKMPGDEWQQFANVRLLYAWMYAHPGKKLLFMGSEFGQRAEWNHANGLDWYVLQFPLHAGIQRLVQYLNYLYKNEPAFFDQDDSYESFEWIDLHDADNSVLSFLRKATHGTTIAIVLNSTPVVRQGYRLGVPHGGHWKEILNTDSEIYGGSNVGNGGGVTAEAVEWQNRPYSVCLTLPPLSVVALKWMDQ